MNITFIRTTLLPILCIILCFLLWKLPLDIDNFEVVITVFLVLIASFLEYKKDIFKSLGFQKQNLKLKNILIHAPLLAFALFLFYYFLLIPSVAMLTGSPIDFSDFEELIGNLPLAAITLLFVWISAAFGEEVIWRGYFMRQFSKFFGKNKLSLIVNITLFGILFGYMHAYQGVTGQIITGIMGSLLALIFHLRKSDLWFNIAVHGFFDTLALLVLYNGWI